MKRISVIIGCLLVLSLILLPVGCAAQPGAPIVLKISHSEKPGGGSKDLNSEYLAKLINERSEGRLIVEVYPTAQLYADKQGNTAVADGTIFAEATSSNPASAWSTAHKVFGLWGLFQDPAHVKRFWDSDCGGGEAAKELEAKGIIHLPVGPLFIAHIFSNAPVEAADDVQGLRLRVMESPLVVKGATAITGTDAIVVPINELYTAAGQGMVDGTITGLKAIESRGIHEFFDYCVIEPPVYAVCTTIFISKKQVDDLPGNLQKIVYQAIEDTYDNSWSLPVDYFSKGSYDTMKAAGVTFTTVPPAEFAKLMAMYKPIFDEGSMEIPGGYVECAQSLRQ